MTWTAHADEITGDAAGLGRDCARVNAAAWSAGADPEATHGIVGAALTLGASVPSLSARCDPLPDDRTMVSAAADLEAACAETLAAARGLRDRAARETDDACDAIAAVSRDPGERAAAVIAAAQRRIADCETAMESLDVTIKRLAYALACLERVGTDLEAAYEAPYGFVRAGGRLPLAGDWLTGSRSTA